MVAGRTELIPSNLRARQKWEGTGVWWEKSEFICMIVKKTTSSSSSYSLFFNALQSHSLCHCDLTHWLTDSCLVAPVPVEYRPHVPLRRLSISVFDAFIKPGWSHNGVMFGSQFYTKLCLHDILTWHMTESERYMLVVVYRFILSSSVLSFDIFSSKFPLKYVIVKLL